MTRYSLFVLKVSLNSNQPTNQLGLMGHVSKEWNVHPGCSYSHDFVHELPVTGAVTWLL